MRCFVSVELTDEIKSNIAKIIEEIKRDYPEIKWVKPGNLHLTLKFLGWVKDGQQKNIIKTLDGATKDIRALKLKVSGCGVFPSPTRPRVVWLDIAEGAEPIRKIAGTIDDALGELGYKKEEREWQAHITIGRVREPKQARGLFEKLRSCEKQEFGEMVVERISLMESKLSPKGPTYLEIRNWKLDNSRN
ncbi:MAG: RNA 2',3'-cyclic phosphodiesterase [Candidatus Margulisiibacteriota bacterium]|nr:RNA 2',3'-cyclic phosphodiesterase [Candidatus Margulisiibacteriota bacterium]